MIDKFQFSDNQDFVDPDSTGEISDSIWDLEESGVVDGFVSGFLNVRVNSATISGLTQGLDIELRSSDAEAGTTPQYLGVIKLLPAEVVAGNQFSIGVNKAVLHKYLCAWVKAVNTANTGTIYLEIWFADTPVTAPRINIQKKPS